MAINRNSQCNNNFGGIDKIYIFPYQNIPRSNISVIDNILLEFPNSTVYDLNANEINFTENIDSEDGGVVYNQTGSFQLKKILITDDYKSLSSRDWRIIVKDNNNNYRLIGLETGVKIKFTKNTGTNLQDFNGFNLTFDTKEENTAPFLSDLSFFNITDIINIIFIEMTFNTYAEMIAFGVPTNPVVARVLIDENKGLSNTEYKLFADGVRMWIANTSDK